jgi:hypothetical protein
MSGHCERVFNVPFGYSGKLSLRSELPETEKNDPKKDLEH